MIYPARILKLRVRGTKKDIAQDISNEEVCFVMDRVIARFDGSDLQVIDFNVVTILKFAEVCFLFDLSNVQILYCSCLEEPSFFFSFSSSSTSSFHWNMWYFLITRVIYFNLLFSLGA